MAPLPRVCVIGAGSSGIAVVKALKDRGLPHTCFEKGDELGGNWCFRNSNGMSAAYESLHINTDAKLMEYRDYPMPPGTPDYPSHRVIKAYFDDYADRFGLREHIRFGTEVTRARRRDDGAWEITLDYGATELFDALVVGMGNSAMDIACELSRPGIAERLYLSARRGVWILPKYLFGVPMSRLGMLPHWFPWQLGSVLTRLAVTLNAGTPWRFGLPRPDHRMLQAHPTISQEVFIRLGSGDILPRPGIRRLKGERVEFTDGREEAVDVIFWCTGYKLSLPFFDPEFISAPGNDLPLWERMVKPGIDNLFFVGLLQPLGAIMPIAEAQGRFIGDHLLGHVALPGPATMAREMARERAAMFRRYRDHSPRHTMQVDFEDYLHRLRKHARRGAQQARRLGQPLSVPTPGPRD